jgi:hypothetical protein
VLLRLALIGLCVWLAVLAIVMFVPSTQGPLQPPSTTSPPKTASSQPTAPQSVPRAEAPARPTAPQSVPRDQAPARPTAPQSVPRDQAPARPTAPQSVPVEAPAQPAATDSNTTDATEKMAALRKAIEALPKGNIVLHAPTKVTVGDQREVKASVGIDVPMATLRKQLGPSDQQVEGSLYLSPEMAATLHGPGFTIEPTTPEQQSIAEGFPTIWSWNVTAKQEGEEELEATLYVLVFDGNKTTRLRVESYTQTINVSVRAQTWGEWLDSVSHELGAVKTIAVTIGGIVTVVIGWFGIRTRPRKPIK